MMRAEKTIIALLVLTALMAAGIFIFSAFAADDDVAQSPQIVQAGVLPIPREVQDKKAAGETNTENPPQAQQAELFAAAPQGQDPASALPAAPAANDSRTDSPDDETLPPADPTIGNSAPDFELSTMDGQVVRLADLRGKSVLLNYWVSWCEPCKEEMQAIETIYQQYAGQDLVILSVNGIEQDTQADIQAVLAETGVTFPVLLDEGDTIYKSYRVLFLPTSFFIDARGVIQDIVLGSTDLDGFRSRVDHLLAAAN